MVEMKGERFTGISIRVYIDLEIAAAGNTEVMSSKMKTMKMLGLNQTVLKIC